MQMDFFLVAGGVVVLLPQKWIKLETSRVNRHTDGRVHWFGLNVPFDETSCESTTCSRLEDYPTMRRNAITGIEPQSEERMKQSQQHWLWKVDVPATCRWLIQGVCYWEMHSLSHMQTYSIYRHMSAVRRSETFWEGIRIYSLTWEEHVFFRIMTHLNQSTNT